MINCRYFYKLYKTKLPQKEKFFIIRSKTRDILPLKAKLIEKRTMELATVEDTHVMAMHEVLPYF